MRKNNKGSAIVLVLVVFAIVGTLAALGLYLALQNYQMKVTDSKVKDNFYSAEMVLDQVCAGLQADVSSAYGTAYDEALPQYMTYVLAEDEDGWNQIFGSEYVLALRNQLGTKDANNKLVSDMRYSIDKLSGYVEVNTSDPSVLPYAQIESTTADADGNGLMVTDSDGLVLRGVKVTYTDAKGITSIIQTDIRLAVPNISFETEGETPDTFSFCMIANEGIQMNQTGETKVSGNIYSGSPYVLDSSKTDESDKQSFYVKSGASVNIENISYMLAEGNVNLDGTNAKLTLANNSQLWTDNINVKSATANLYGTMYVADDLTLSGTSPKVILGTQVTGDGGTIASGAYIGYGTSTTDAAKSSSIIVNGKSSVLDMSNLAEITVAGYSYLATSDTTQATPGVLNHVAQVNKNVSLGESIAIKGDQIAYLAPTQWIGTDDDGAYAESIYASNPLTVGQYKELMKRVADSDDDAVEINPYTAGSSVGGKSLADYIGTSKVSNVDQYIYKVFVRSKTSNEDDGLVYFYVNLPQDAAEQYYEDYYSNDQNRGEYSNLNAYANFYSDGIKVLSDDSLIHTAGAYSAFDQSTNKVSVGESNASSIQVDLAGCTTDYNILTSILKLGNASDTQLASIVFDNIVDDAIGGNFRKVTAAGAGGRVTYTYAATLDDGTTKNYKAIVTNESDFTYDSTRAECQDVYLIVSSGNVKVSSDFTGTIIAKGLITVDKAVTITNNTVNFSVNDMKNLLKYATDSTAEDANHLYDVFINGKSYFKGMSFTDAGTDSELDYGSLIYYQNWLKL